MDKISSAQSLMNFNKRVLTQGIPSVMPAYDLDELKSLLFFNKVFTSNMDEMFEKYPNEWDVTDYIECLIRMIKNVDLIIQYTMGAKKEILFSTEDSFERRFVMATTLTDQIMTQYYTDIEMVHYPFESGKIYYIGIMKNRCISISHIDMRRDIYHRPMSYQVNGQTVYWKTDECIKDFIKHDLQAVDIIAVKVTTKRSNRSVITKVEYNGSSNLMRALSPIFGRRALIVSNPFIYLDDIDQMISDHIPASSVKETQKFKPINALDLLEEDELMEYPLDSFDDYLHFLRSAVVHPETKKIYLTLYRIGSDPSIFYILKDAVEKGIEVNVNIELFASGEKINQTWLEEMERIGVHVTTYAAGKLKVHSKLTLVKFNNGQSIAQIGTGNYHTKTTSQYTDLSLMTSDEVICHQIEKVFKIFDGKHEDTKFNDDLLVTRYNARRKLIELIDSEGKKKDDGYICIKCNALNDDEILTHLDRAAKAGCNIDLIIRGVCTWIPQELCRNVRIKSIIWDKLEHSRIYVFGASNPIIYMGSLDLVKNKLDQRIETLVRIKRPNILIKVCSYINRYITNTKGSWLMVKGGNYVKE